jgi:hypothetical protein
MPEIGRPASVHYTPMGEPASNRRRRNRLKASSSWVESRSMRIFRIAVSVSLLLGITLSVSAQANPGSHSDFAFVLAEPAFPDPPPPGVISTTGDTRADYWSQPSATEAPALSPEGLALPGIHLPEPPGGSEPPDATAVSDGQTIATARAAAIVVGRAGASVWLDPGPSTASGARRPPAEELAVPGEGAPVTVAPARIIAAPPEGWTPQWPAVAREGGGVVAERQVIAYYGHPNSTRMGILGESPIEEMAADLLARAAEYDEINGPIGVAPAFHIIYGTVWEDANIGILRETILLEYIEFAQANGIIVFLDHQIGRFTVAEAIESMLPYLAYDHVHLAIDPEWATTAPGQEIGHISAQDLNAAQETISNYLIQNNIGEPKMLVVHQFNWRMIANRELVRTDYPGVQLIHNADGFGQPAEKIVSWESNVQAANMPLKGFKLFYPKSWRDGGYDDPLLSPIEVMQLEPVPVYIQYQ